MFLLSTRLSRARARQWCGHCKALAPEYEKLATALKGSVQIAKTDATVAKALGARFKVQGFPTIIWMAADGRAYTFDGERTIPVLTEFVQARARPCAPPRVRVQSRLAPPQGGYASAKSTKIPAPYVRTLSERYNDLIAGNEASVNMFWGFLMGTVALRDPPLQGAWTAVARL